jgi:dienelactone hydrolase
VSGQLSWKPTQAPANGEEAVAHWLEIRFPQRGSERRLLVAVFEPEGDGPFPVVVYLHGSSGLATPMLRWAPNLSKAGFLVLAGCYAITAAVRDRIACPDAPLVGGDGVPVLLELAHQIPKAKQDKVGVLGLSAGAGFAFELLGGRTDIVAAVADSGNPSRLDIRDAAKVRGAVLLLASPIDSLISITAVRDYERTLRAAGKAVDAHYYPDGMHVVTLSQPTAEDATQRTIDFFRNHLH